MSDSFFLVEAYGCRTESVLGSDAQALFSDKDEAVRVFRRAHDLGLGARITVLIPDRERALSALEEFIEDQAVLAKEPT